MYLDKAKERFEELKIAEHADISPCTEEEVASLEQQINIRLPDAYREFLLWMGKDGGKLFRGTDSQCEHLPKLKSWAVELLTKNGLANLLPDDAFVFLMHQGYTFLFFRTSEGPDPPVYSYSEPSHQTSFTTAAPSFSSFLVDLIEGHARRS